jgi:hypothetical protein
LVDQAGGAMPAMFALTIPRALAILLRAIEWAIKMF